MFKPSAAISTIEGNEDVAIQADERQQQQRDAVNDQSSSRDHFLDGGRKTERGRNHGRRDSHDEKPYCTWRAQKLVTNAPLNGQGKKFLMLLGQRMFPESDQDESVRNQLVTGP